MRHQYAIDPEIQALLPVPTPEELANLRSLLIGDRHCDDLVVLHIESENANVLGDGHNRETICREEDIAFNTRRVKVADRGAAIQWVIRNQLGRRNLTDERRAYYMGKEYLNAKQPHGGQAKKGEPTSGSPSRTAEKIAEDHGVSPTTVKTNAAFAAAVDTLPPAEKEAVLSGASGKPKSAIVEQAKAIHCERCARVGPVKDCPRCAEARKAAGSKKVGTGKKKPPKNGQAVWTWKAFETSFGALVREIDKLGGAYKAKTSKTADDLRTRLKDFKAAMLAWQKELAGASK